MALATLERSRRSEPTEIDERENLAWLSRFAGGRFAQLIEEKADRQAGQEILEEERWENGRPLAFDKFCEQVGPPLKPRQLWAIQQAGMMEPECLLDPGRKIQELVLCYGKGSGKDWLSARLVAWATYVCLNLKGAPAAHFGLDPKTELHILNTAPNEDSAENIFFKPYLKPLIQSDIFKPWIKNEKDQILTSEIRFPEKRIVLYSMHSRMSGLDGYNTVLWVMDEADDFLDSEKRSLAAGVHDVLRGSANTRFNGRHWCGIVISYPRSKDGFMLGTIKLRAEKDPTFFWDLAATWDVRPEVSRYSPGIASDYEADPTGSRARYECQPGETEGAFIKFPERITQSQDISLFPCCEWQEQITRITLHDGTESELVGVELGSIRRDPGREYFMGGDGAWAVDSFTLSVWSVETSTHMARWLCRDCGGRGNEMDDVLQVNMRAGATYRKGVMRETVLWTPEVACGVCGAQPTRIGPSATQALIDGWWYNQQQEDFSLSIQGERLTMPRIREDLLIEFRPQQAIHQGQQNRPVDFESDTVGVRAVCRQLCGALSIRHAAFDPSHAVGVVQALRRDGHTADVIPFTNKEQFLRGRFVKTLLYQGGLQMLHKDAMPNEVMRRTLERRDTDWKRLQLNAKTKKLDHPSGGRKDCWDSETVAIWKAGVWCVPQLAEMMSRETAEGAPFGREVREMAA